MSKQLPRGEKNPCAYDKSIFTKELYCNQQNMSQKIKLNSKFFLLKLKLKEKLELEVTSDDILDILLPLLDELVQHYIKMDECKN